MLVTGGAGLLGEFVVDELLSHGHTVGVLDIKPPRPEVLPVLRYHKCSILDLEATVAAVGAGYDRVIQLAGIDDGIEATEHEFFATNVQGAWNVLYAAELAGVEKVVLASSCRAFELDADNPPEYVPVDERHPLRATHAYSLSKELIERTAANFTRRGSLDTIVLRPTLILRPVKVPEVVTALNQLGEDQGIRTGAPPYNPEWLPTVRTYISSRDAAAAFVAAASSDLCGHHVFIISAPDTLGRVDTLRLMADMYGEDRPRVASEERYAQRPDASVLDSTAITRAIGMYLIPARSSGDHAESERCCNGRMGGARRLGNNCGEVTTRDQTSGWRGQSWR